MSNEDDECDSASLFPVASQSDVNSFLRSQAAKITGVVNSSISDDDDSSMDGSLVARFTQIPSEKKLSMSNNSSRPVTIKPYLSRSCFASLTSSSSPSKNSTQKIVVADDLTELKWLNTFKFKEFKDDLTISDTKDKETDEKKTCLNPDATNNDEDRVAKLISELKSYDSENSKLNTNSFGVLIFLALYSQRDEKQMAWSLAIKQFYEYIQSNAKQISNKRGWKNSLRQALVSIPCFVKTKRDLLKSRSLWTIDPYYRPLLTKAYLSNPPVTSATLANKTLSDAATNRHDEHGDASKAGQSIVSNFAPKATVKTKVLPRLYERLCEEKADEPADEDDDDDDEDDDDEDEDDDDEDDEDEDEEDDEADSSHPLNRSAGRKRPRSSSSTGHRHLVKNKRRSSTSPTATKFAKRPKRRHHHSLEIEPKTSTPNRKSTLEHRSSSIPAIVTPCPSLDHNYLHPSEKNKGIERTKSTGSIEYNDPSAGDSEEDDERDSSSVHRPPVRKSIITTRAQAAAKNHSHHRRKSSPPKKRSAVLLPPHRPNTRISRRIIEQDLKLLRQGNALAPLSPPSNQQPLDLSLGSAHRSSSFEDEIRDKAVTEQKPTSISNKTDEAPVEGVLDLSLSR